MPAHGFTAVGVVLEDFEAPGLDCACGGDAHDSLHAFSLLHLEWAWRQNGLTPVAGSYRKFAAQ